MSFMENSNKKLLVGVEEGKYCMEHWGRCINNGFGTLKNKIKFENKNKNRKPAPSPRLSQENILKVRNGFRSKMKSRAEG